MSEGANDNNEGELLAGKYKTTEELVAGYTELQAKLSAGTKAPVTPEAPKAPADTGVDFGTLTQELQTTGDLSFASKAALIAKGIPEEVINTHVASVKSGIEQQTNALYEHVGGKDAYETMHNWASQNLSQAERDTLNAMSAGSLDAAKAAIEVVKVRYEAVNGKDPVLSSGGAGAGGSDAYESVAQLTKDMGSDLYKTDPAEQARVQAKLARSTKI